MKPETTSDYIEALRRFDNGRGDKLLEFLEEYNLMGLREATAQQLKEFYDKQEDER